MHQSLYDSGLLDLKNQLEVQVAGLTFFSFIFNAVMIIIPNKIGVFKHLRHMFLLFKWMSHYTWNGDGKRASLLPALKISSSLDDA